MRVLVLGAGIFGISAACELRRRGHEVAVFDRGAIPGPAHDASSCDSSRAVRMDYGDDAFSIDLAREALERWRGGWGRRGAQAVYHEAGFVFASARRFEDDEAAFEATCFRELARRAVRVERIGREDVARDYAHFDAEAWVDGYMNRDAGYADAAAVTRNLQLEARDMGCALHAGRCAVALGEGGSGSAGATRVLMADGACFEGDAILVACGAWSASLVPELRAVLRATAQSVLYLRPQDPDRYRAQRYPTWAWDIAGAGWYGFPLSSDGLVKIAHHGAGRRFALDPARSDEVSVDAAVEPAARAFLRRVLPGLAEARLAEARVCHYCDTVDGDFWIDRIPASRRIFVATGGSGHGFKFAPVLGELIAHRIEAREDPRLVRFAWRQPQNAREHARSLRGVER